MSEHWRQQQQHPLKFQQFFHKMLRRELPYSASGPFQVSLPTLDMHSRDKERSLGRWHHSGWDWRPDCICIDATGGERGQSRAARVLFLLISHEIQISPLFQACFLVCIPFSWWGSSTLTNGPAERSQMLQSIMWFTGEPRLACSAHPGPICNLLNSVNAVDNCQVLPEVHIY